MKKKDITYNGGTSNLKFHLETYHKDKLSELEMEEKSKKSSQSSITNFAVNVPASSKVKKWPRSSALWFEKTRLLAEWIVTSSRPFEIVEDPGFIAYSNSIRPEYDVPCRQTITNYIEKEYKKKKDELKKELEPIEFVAVTTDGGSSSNATSFQDINVHFINSEWEMKSATLAVTENKGEHTAKRYREITDEIVEDIKERVKKNVNFPMMIKASALDPRFKRLKFIPSNSRDDVFKSLKTEADLILGGTSRATTDEGVEKNTGSTASKK